MTSKDYIKHIGEVQLIKIIEDILFQETGYNLIRDDVFFFESQAPPKSIILNTDMFVSTTDAPVKMNYFQMGHKSVIMNISDLVVKGVKPKGIIISLGLPMTLLRAEFEDLIRGIIACSKNWNLNYLGGDLNESKEIIISPTVFGFKNPKNIIRRAGVKEGDFLVINNKFGLTSVGFDILLNKKGDIKTYPKYARSIKSVLEPNITANEGIFLSNMGLASASIDSSDGLVKSLRDLMQSNKDLGFEIEINDNLVDPEAIKYAIEYNVSIESLILKGGEEFIHLFTIPPENYKKSIRLAKSEGGFLIKVGKVIPGEKIYFLKENERLEITDNGYEHFK
jgi:thiamine-monophosphate kinase